MAANLDLYLLLWIVLEALFGANDPRETTYRLSQRIAFFLASDQEPRTQHFKEAKAGYGWRSKVVHGMKIAKLPKDTSGEIMYCIEVLIRKTLNRLLRDRELVQIFSGTKREDYLDNLNFWIRADRNLLRTRFPQAGRSF